MIGEAIENGQEQDHGPYNSVSKWNLYVKICFFYIDLGARFDGFQGE